MVTIPERYGNYGILPWRWFSNVEYAYIWYALDKYEILENEPKINWLINIIVIILESKMHCKMYYLGSQTSI